MGAMSRCCLWFILCILCICLLAFVFGVVVFFTWVTVRAKKSGASFYVQKFYVPALNSTAGGNYTADNTTSVSFVLNIRNTINNIGIYYDDLNVTFSYGGGKSLEIGSYKLDGFHQHPRANTYAGDSVAVKGVPWNTIAQNGLEVDFRVDLATKVRYSQMFLKGKRRQVRVRAVVQVNDTTGLKIKKKSIRLTSGATQPGRSTRASVAFSLLIILLFHM